MQSKGISWATGIIIQFCVTAAKSGPGSSSGPEDCRQPAAAAQPPDARSQGGIKSQQKQDLGEGRVQVTARGPKAPLKS